MIDFSGLYERYAVEVFRFALYLCGNRADAEDITSETFVRALAASDRIRTPTVKAYLFEIARNIFLMNARRSRSAPISDQIRDPQPSACDVAEQRSEMASVLAHLQKLPAVDRAALLMKTVEERSYEEIASVLKITAVSARVKVHRARTALLQLGET